jgi:UDP-N-acetylglucosamine 2-epimerase
MRPECEVVLTRRGEPAHEAGELLARMSEVLDYVRPRSMLVHGSLPGARAAVTASSLVDISVGQLGAGLRTYAARDRSTEQKDRDSSRPVAIHFAANTHARARLLHEGIDEAAIVVTGDTAVDATRCALERLRASNEPLVDAEVTDFIADYAAHRVVLVTLDRRQTGRIGIARMAPAVTRILREHDDVAVIWPVDDDREVAQAVAAGLAGLDPFSAARLLLARSLDYPTLIATLRSSWIALTDSSDNLEETVSMGVPLLVCSDTSEAPEVLAAGCARLAGTSADSIRAAFAALKLDRAAHALMRRAGAENPFGDGQAAERICEALLQTA